ncbi:serine protease [Trichuris trichiura]|uniref:Acrosin n=1 Tax=Trichuris trichiura TaxID=36087 RepID=A0A077YX58_TRITR|nr:serine protease [Trichuris trichiura]
MKILFLLIVAASCQVTLGEQWQCGIAKYSLNPKPKTGNRIVGGWEAKPHSLPWQVRLVIYMDDKSNAVYKCGGTLIQMVPGNGTDLVLTAAHCFFDPETGEWTPERRVYALVGIHNEKNDKELTRHVLKAKSLFFNKQFAKVGIAEDIALVQLEQLVPYTDETRPICLPEKDERLEVGKDCFTSGWGRTKEQGPNSDALQMVDAKVQADQYCVNQLFRGIVFCAGHLEGGKDACEGDSGGPLFCPVNGRIVQYGIVSQGEGCARKNMPGEYTKLSKFVTWLESSVKQFPSYSKESIKPATTKNPVLFEGPASQSPPAKLQIPAPQTPTSPAPTATKPSTTSGSRFTANAGKNNQPPRITPRPYVSPYLRL